MPTTNLQKIYFNNEMHTATDIEHLNMPNVIRLFICDNNEQWASIALHLTICIYEKNLCVNSIIPFLFFAFLEIFGWVLLIMISRYYQKPFLKLMKVILKFS